MLNLFLEKFALRKKENVLMKRNVIEFLGFCLSLLPTRNFRLNLDFYLFLSKNMFVVKFTILTFIFSFLKFFGNFTPQKRRMQGLGKAWQSFKSRILFVAPLDQNFLISTLAFGFSFLKTSPGKLIKVICTHLNKKKLDFWSSNSLFLL